MNRIIAKNIHTGDYVEDLGMVGEYPWSSSVGRRVKIGDRVEEEWFPTEINPRGLTDLEEYTRACVCEVDPTIAVNPVPMAYHNYYWKVNQIGDGIPIPSVDLQMGDIIADSTNGFRVDKDKLPPELVQAISSFLESKNKEQPSDDEFDYSDEEYDESDYEDD